MASRVVLVDLGHELVSDVLRRVLENREDVLLAGECTAADAPQRARALRADVAIYGTEDGCPPAPFPLIWTPPVCAFVGRRTSRITISIPRSTPEGLLQLVDVALEVMGRS